MAEIITFTNQKGGVGKTSLALNFGIRLKLAGAKVLFVDMDPQCNLTYIMGIDEDKLAGFTFADETFHVNKIPDDLTFDHAFECVGGQGCEMADNQIIDYIRPEGTIALMGVSENRVPINTRMVLEKGLRIFGSSRSGREDFVNTVEFLAASEKNVNLLAGLVDSVIEVQNIDDMNKAFESDIRKAGGKTIMLWKV